MLARFHADPARVRVGICRLPDGRWRAIVEPRPESSFDRDPLSSPFGYQACSSSPTSAVYQALDGAEASGVEGIDLGLEWAYEHPQKPGDDE